MSSWFLSLFVTGFMILFARIGSVDVISWDDMRVDLGTDTFSSGDDTQRSSNRSNGRVIVVDQSGNGDSYTVQGAVDLVPFNNSQRVKIYILPGIYREKVIVPASKPYVSFIGVENRTEETVITWHDKCSDVAADGRLLGTFRSASVAVESDFFCATGITFQNTVVAQPGSYGNQAVALKLGGDKAMLYKIRVLGSQDTLLDAVGSHYFYQCYIEGAIDFIFGRSRSLYQDCVFHSTANTSGAIAAHHRDSEYENTGFSFVNCTVNGSGNVFLGRAWGNYSRIIYSYCNIDSIITPAGWSDWNQTYRQQTAVFGEYKCNGSGATRHGRVQWSKALSYHEARNFLDMKFIDGEQWLRL